MNNWRSWMRLFMIVALVGANSVIVVRGDDELCEECGDCEIEGQTRACCYLWSSGHADCEPLVSGCMVSSGQCPLV